MSTASLLSLSWSDRRRAWLAVLAVAPAASMAAIAGLVLGEGQLGAALWLCSKIWLIVVPLVWHLKVDGGRLSLSPPRHGGLGVGVGLGLVAAGAVLGAWMGVGRGWIEPAVIQASLADTGLLKPAVYLGVAALLGGGFLALAWRLTRTISSRNARRLYLYSLLYLALLFTAMMVDSAATL